LVFRIESILYFTKFCGHHALDLGKDLFIREMPAAYGPCRTCGTTGPATLAKDLIYHGDLFLLIIADGCIRADTYTGLAATTQVFIDDGRGYLDFHGALDNGCQHA
jgi:hypothetical protein